jgi:hypothetical protein
MHIALTLTVLLAAFDPPGPVPAAALPTVVKPVDPCAGQETLPAEPLCGATPLCAARDRVRTACELRDAVRTRYVFLDQKRTLLGPGFDPSARLDACVVAERAIAREEEPLRFYDRVRACTGAFEDGHLIVSTPQRLPQVALGVGLRRAGGRIVVASREAGLRGLVGDATADALPIGAEVVEIDGVATGEAAAALARAVPGSSAAARLERAVEALTRRDFSHPERRTAALTVALAPGQRRTVQVPWWVSPGAERHPVAGRWANRVRLQTTDRLAWFDDAARPRRGTAVEGAPAWAPVVPAAAAAALREYADDAGRIAVRLGAVETGVAQPFCYLQILTFHTEGLAGPEGKGPFVAVVERFIRGCGEKRRDVVLDLRRNEGGYLDHSSAVAEALAPAGAPDAPAALLLRATERNEAIYRERSGSAPPGEDALAPRHILDAIGSARRDGRPLTPAFVSGAGGAAGAGFPGRVIALTSPACMSACDRLAALLKASGRAVLVGGPTEGAGGSQQETPGIPAKWTDSSRLLSVAIPNAAFGVRRAAAGLVVTAGDAHAADPAARLGPEVPAPVFFETFGIENHPIEPDVRYEPKADDVTGAGKGWLEQVNAILSGTPLAALGWRPLRTG